MIENFYTQEGRFIVSLEDSGVAQVRREVVLENPSGLKYTGQVIAVGPDECFEGERAVTVAGKWEWED